MNASAKLVLILLGSLLFSAAGAQNTSDDEANVLLVIEHEWEAARKGDQDKVDDMLTNDFMGWGKSSPAPRSKTSTSNWSRFSTEMGRVVRYELYPLSITIHEDVAIAHYLYSSAFKDKQGKIEISNGRYTDVLIRTEDGWKFIAWHGGDDD
ncbi:MAG: nuclear transport factor 2 family protein [Gammaproteobacteria bacterium]|jgi:ketosteroid isomerase-like protein|nr:nuclear transport factor 2 family protein [Gammaproteobacteria bacterium]MDH3811284.1 nuclear transport factor 2 family protein [Gammaproteobacteria bacterium]